jgi:hypothetical protein
MMRVLDLIARGTRVGEPPDRNALAAREPHLSDTQLDRMLGELRDARCAHRTELGTWVLLRDPTTVSLAELFEAGHYRWPTQHELARYRARATPGDHPLLALLEQAASAQEGLLGNPVASVLPPA